MGKKKQVRKKESLLSNPKTSYRLSQLLIVLLVFLLYGNTLFNKFALDDHNVILNNEQVQRGISAIPEIFTTPYSTEEGLSFDYRPLVKATFAIEYSLYGLRPFWHHFINLLLYALTGLLLFRILKQLLGGKYPAIPILATLLFIAHPVHTEIVASLKNRDELLSMLGALLSVFYLLKYANTNKLKYIGWMSFFFLIGMLGKRTTMTYLAAYPLILYFFTDMPLKKLFRTFGLIFGVFVIIMMLYWVLTPQEVRPLQFFENPLYGDKSFMLRIGTACTSVAFYLKQLFFPYPLISYYGYNAIPVGWSGLWPFAGLASIGVLLVLAFKGLKQKSLISFAILFFFITVSIVSNVLVPVPGIVADRFAYSPSIAFVLLAALLMVKINAKMQKQKINGNALLFLLALIFLIPYSLLTIDRNKDWKDHIILFSHDANLEKNSVKLQALAAEAYSNKVIYDNRYGRDISLIPENQQKVISYYEDALSIYPENYEVLNNLGSFLSLHMRDYEKARPYLEEAVKVKPEESAGWFNLGFVYEKLNLSEKAEEAYKKSIALNAQDFEAQSFLANLLFSQGDKKGAIKLNREMAKERPDWDQPYINLGNYYLQMADTLQAISQWEEAVKRYPQYQLAIKLSTHYRGKGDMEKSKYFYRLAMQARQRDKGKM